MVNFYGFAVEIATVTKESIIEKTYSSENLPYPSLPKRGYSSLWKRVRRDFIRICFISGPLICLLYYGLISKSFCTLKFSFCTEVLAVSSRSKER